MAITETKPLHFGIETPSSTPENLDPVGDFLQDLLRQLVDLVEFTHQGRKVEVDGFLIRNHRTGRDSHYPIFRAPDGAGDANRQ